MNLRISIDMISRILFLAAAIAFYLSAGNLLVYIVNQQTQKRDLASFHDLIKSRDNYFDSIQQSGGLLKNYPAKEHLVKQAIFKLASEMQAELFQGYEQNQKSGKIKKRLKKVRIPFGEKAHVSVVRNGRFKYYLGADYRDRLSKGWQKNLLNPIYRHITGKKVGPIDEQNLYKGSRAIYSMPQTYKDIKEYINSFRVRYHFHTGKTYYQFFNVVEIPDKEVIYFLFFMLDVEDVSQSSLYDEIRNFELENCRVSFAARLSVFSDGSQIT